MQSPRSVETAIHAMVRRIVEHAHPQRIILFGSHASGRAHADSDVDLLVVLPKNGSKRRKTVELYQVLAGMGVPKDVIVVTPEEIEKYRHVPGTIIEPALREGKVVYDALTGA